MCYSDFCLFDGEKCALADLAQVRNMLDGRYDDIKSGGVEPIDGEKAFDRIRQKSEGRRRS
jgi:hypothetical protein